jgi:alpha,alpha-trehalose phosphorylase
VADHPRRGGVRLRADGQTIVKVPDATLIRLLVDDEPLFTPTAQLREYARVLDMRDGMLSRELEWSTPAGKHVGVRSCRLAISYEVVVRDHAAPVVLRSLVVNHEDLPIEDPAEHGSGALDPRLGSELAARVLNAEVAEHDGLRMLLGYRTSSSGMTLGVGVDHVIESVAPHRTHVAMDGDTGELVVSVDALPGVPIRITKYVTYQSSRSAPRRS